MLGDLLQLFAHGSELWAHQFQAPLDGLLTPLLLVEGAHLSAPFVIKQGQIHSPRPVGLGELAGAAHIHQWDLVQA